MDEDDESYEKRAAAKRRRAAQKQRQKEEEQERMKMLEADAGNLSANAAASGALTYDFFSAVPTSCLQGFCVEQKCFARLLLRIQWVYQCNHLR